MQELHSSSRIGAQKTSQKEPEEYSTAGLPGRALGAARRLTGLRQLQMAGRVGISVSMLKLLERDGATHVEPFCKSLTSYLRELDRHGVKLVRVGNEVVLKAGIN
jgi:DNA-binding transcriptional regulator YiaG